MIIDIDDIGLENVKNVSSNYQWISIWLLYGYHLQVTVLRV